MTVPVYKKTREGQSMTANDQLCMWREGQSIHNDEREECCPDFSCCCPELLAPQEERETFCRADDEAQHVMLMLFLGRAITRYLGVKERADVYLCGLDTPGDVQ